VFKVSSLRFVLDDQGLRARPSYAKTPPTARGYVYVYVLVHVLG